MKALLPAVLAAAIAAVLGGCATHTNRVDAEVEYANARAKFAQPKTQAGGSATQSSERAIVRRIKALPSLPTEFDEQVTLSRGEIPSLDDLSRRLTRLSGFPVRLTREVEDYVASRNSKSASAQVARPPVINPNTNAVVINDEQSMFGMVYTGSKKGLFDAVAARLGCYWRWDKGAVQLYLTDTRAFYIPALPASTTSKESSKAAENGTANASGVRSDVEVTANQNFWVELERTVRSMLSGAGKVVIAPAAGSVIVTDTPDTLERVARLLDEQKKFLSRQVALDVQVFNLTLDDEQSFGVDVNLMTQALNRYGITLASNAGTANGNMTGSSAFSFSILETATGSMARWAGSSVVLNALKGQGTIANLRNANLVSLNNHSVPLRIGKTTTYLAQSSTATTANVGSSTSLQPGSISEGYALNLLPTIMDDDAIMLQLSMNITQLTRLRSISAGTTMIEAPETDEANTIQRAMIRSGETLMLAGFEQDHKAVSDTTGIFSVGTKRARGRTLLVVLVTPTVSSLANK